VKSAGVLSILRVRCCHCGWCFHCGCSRHQTKSGSSRRTHRFWDDYTSAFTRHRRFAGTTYEVSYRKQL